MKKFSLLISLIVFVGCNQKFRSSICTKYLKNIPEEYIGTYKVSLQQLGNSDFISTGGEEMYVYLTEMTILTSSLPTLGDTLNIETNYCKHGDDILIENIDDSGFYTYSLVRNGVDGLSMTPLVLKSKTNLNFIHVPEVKKWEDGKWENLFNLNIDNNNVVNNKNISSQRINQFLSTSSFGVFYERVTNLEAQNIKWKKFDSL